MGTGDRPRPGNRIEQTPMSNFNVSPFEDGYTKPIAWFEAYSFALPRQ